MTLSGIVMLVKLEQYSNANSPIVVTPGSIITLVNPDDFHGAALK